MFSGGKKIPYLSCFAVEALRGVAFCVFVIAWDFFFRVFRVFCGPLFIKVK
jgi:hypothetical protein